MTTASVDEAGGAFAVLLHHESARVYDVTSSGDLDNTPCIN